MITRLWSWARFWSLLLGGLVMVPVSWVLFLVNTGVWDRLPQVPVVVEGDWLLLAGLGVGSSMALSLGLVIWGSRTWVLEGKWLPWTVLSLAAFLVLFPVAYRLWFGAW